MSYDISLNEPISGETIKFETAHFVRGGTYAIGGTQEAWLNITYNYAKHYYRVFGEKGIRTIYGMTGAESIPIIKAAMAQLGDDVSPGLLGRYRRERKEGACGFACLCTDATGRGLGR